MWMYASRNEEDAEKVFGIKASDTDITSGQLNHERIYRCCETVKETFWM